MKKDKLIRKIVLADLKEGDEIQLEDWNIKQNGIIYVFKQVEEQPKLKLVKSEEK